jgi:hypothetical protein
MAIFTGLLFGCLATTYTEMLMTPPKLICGIGVGLGGLRRLEAGEV